MSHLDPETLWDLPPAPGAELAAHLTGCPDCRAQLAQVQRAKSLLVSPGPVPALNPIAMRRIGAVLKEAAEEQLKPRAWWWPFELSPMWAVGAVAAALLAFLVWNLQSGGQPAQVPIAQHESPEPPKQQLANAPPTAAPPAVIPEQIAPRPKLLAKVTSTRRAKNGATVLEKSQTLAEGSNIKTESGGALWLALPDGSKAGLTGATELKLDTLEDKQLGFSLAKGDVLVVAKHLPERELTVKAGEVEIRDIGTRFLVSRDAQRVLVAVEEGVVQVNAPGNKLTLKAGRSAEWREGQLIEQAWAPTPPVQAAPKKVVSTPTPPIEALQNPAPAPEASNTPPPATNPRPPPPPTPTPAELKNPDEEWGTPSNLPKTVAPAPSPVAAAPVTPEVAPVSPPSEAPEEEEASVLSIAGVEQRLKKLSRAVKAPFAAVGSTIRETRAREVGRLADEHNCNEALRRADVWLSEKATESPEEPRWRRLVQVNQLRCYTQLHRDADATKLKEQLQ